ncbi:MAG TPA: cation diffusion facilitator family transporter [Thermoanaerobaculia bacterium]|nr:cation diffusion facilitator family transporter [Thermoanaerobaculia bacterium]
MGAGHAHHGHGHSASNRRRLALTLALAAVYMLAEAVGGWLTGSLALLADAGHMLSDAAALGLSLFAIWIAQRPPTPRRTWGYHRTEILAALANGATLVAISVWVVVEAVERFRNPPEVDAPVMMAIAVGGLAVNLIGLAILSGGRNDSLNVRGAWLHVLTDALGSVQAIAAGVLIWAYGWLWADPVASILISLLVVYSAWHLLKETVGVLMEGTPAHIDLDEVRNALADLPGVCEVHDLHVWTITSGMEALSAHLVVVEETSTTLLLQQVQSSLHDRFGIHHTTVQIEPEPCGRYTHP